MRNVKIILLITVFCFGFIPSHGQTITPKKTSELNFSELTPINLIIDYSEMKIMGIPECYFIAFEDLWEPSKKRFYKSFCYAINERTSRWNKMVFGHFDNSDYELVIKMLEMDEDGDAEYDARFFKKDGSEIVSIIGIESDGSGSSFISSIELSMPGPPPNRRSLKLFLSLQKEECIMPA